MKAHRGVLILVLGILSLVTGCAPVLGPIAWILGNNDLKEIRAGTMDPSGEGMTNAGKICGMIATILSVVVICLYLLIFLGVFGGAFVLNK
jgi:hypothetical protein